MIQCTLEHAFFGDLPVYEALSYTWGEDPTKLREIRVDGSVVNIQFNLWSALDMLRREYTCDRVIWADALCINQNDPNERSRQVAMMKFIYTRAKRVHVWLGKNMHPAPKEPDVAPRRRSLFPTLNEPVRYETIQWKKVKPGTIDLSRRDLAWISTNRYWERLWIIQEVCSAKRLDVVYADGVIGSFITTVWRWPWEDFVGNFKYLKGISTTETLAPLILRLEKQRRDKYGESGRFENVLEAFKDAKCKEPHDKIYGLLGLAYDWNHEDISIDYTRPLVELFESVVRFVHSSRRLDEITFPEAIDRPMRLIQFAQFVQHVLRIRHPGPYNPQLNPDGGLPGGSGASDWSLLARGLYVATVLHVGPSVQEIAESASANQRWEGSFRNHFSKGDLQEMLERGEVYKDFLLKKLERNGLARLRQYGRTLQSGGSSGAFCEEDWLTGRPTKIYYNRFPSNPGRLQPPPVPKDHHPRLFLASNFTLGIAPYGIKVGDVLCRFWNTSIIAVMRPRQPFVYHGEFRVYGRAHVVGPAQKFTPREQDSGVMEIWMDMQTIQVLTCGDDD